MLFLKQEVGVFLDHFQFAFRQGRGTDDAINSISHLVSKHLEDPKAYACILFVDFSSALNMLQPHMLIQKLKHMNVNSFILTFLINRTQQVRMNNALMEPRPISTGAPQGCVSSPVLFTLYTNDCTRLDTLTIILSNSQMIQQCSALCTKIEAQQSIIRKLRNLSSGVTPTILC